MDADDELFGALDKVASTARLLVACGFDGALVEPSDDPAGDRATQEASGALNVLVSAPDTVVAVVSERPADEVAELMFLSGAKGGLRVVRARDVPALRDEAGITAMVGLGISGPAVGSSLPGDVLVGLGGDEGTDYVVEDVDAVADALEELAALRRL